MLWMLKPMVIDLSMRVSVIMMTSRIFPSICSLLKACKDLLLATRIHSVAEGGIKDLTMLEEAVAEEVVLTTNLDRDHLLLRLSLR